MPKMNIMDSTGHTELLWKNPEEKTKGNWSEADDEAVNEAMTKFNALLGEGKTIIDKDGGVRAKTFDPTVNEYTVLPHMVGG